MNNEKIEQLLEKFYAGETSLEEEQQLASYFEKSEVAPELEIAAKQFKYYKFSKDDKALDDKFLNKVFENLESGREESPKVVSLNYYWATGVAASLIVCFSIYYQFYDMDRGSRTMASSGMINTYDDPQLAYQETKNALLMISSKLNKGTKELQKISKFSEAQQLINN